MNGLMSERYTKNETSKTSALAPRNFGHLNNLDWRVRVQRLPG